MDTKSRHFRFINSTTGNPIYYHTIAGEKEATEVNEELEKVRAEVAVVNGVFNETIYWEEVKEKTY